MGSILREACLKISLLIKTSAPRIKSLCELLLFIHFISENLDNYNKIVKEYQKKQLQKIIKEVENDYIFILGYRINTIILLILMKLNKDELSSNLF